MTTHWTPDDVRRISLIDIATPCLIRAVDRSYPDPATLYWDMWPIQRRDGYIAQVHGREVWMALTAPDRGDPSLRHFEAKIRFLERRDGNWHDLGPVLPEFQVPYEREWAGSACLDGDQVTLFFTGAGVHDRPHGYQQALFEAHGTLATEDHGPGLAVSWDAPRQSVTQMTPDYMPADAHEGEAGKIKAFRDPAYFCDPADGGEYLIFTGSLANAKSTYNGAIGIARKSGASWDLLPPLIHADGVNNELERAHIVYSAGRYYAFWATQTCTFSPELRHAPNGLYGMVADHLFGPYRPLNGSGLVLANPAQAPTQAYSWFVSADLIVASFVDAWGEVGKAAQDDLQFGGVPAPLLKLRVDGDLCLLETTGLPA